MSALRISSSCHSLSSKPLGPKRFTTLAVKSSKIAGEESELLSLLMSLNLNEMPAKNKSNHLSRSKIRNASEASTNLQSRAKFTSSSSEIILFKDPVTHLKRKSSEQVKIVDKWCYNLRLQYILQGALKTRSPLTLCDRGRLLCELMSLSISGDQSIGETISIEPTKIGCYPVLMGWGVIFMN